MSLLTDGGDLVVGRKGQVDLLGLVDEVQDEGVLLAGRRAVQPRERLHGLHAGEPLVHVHRVQQRLVEAGLVLLGDQQQLVLVACELLGQLLLLDALVHADLGESWRRRSGSITSPEKATSVLMSV